MSTLTLFPIAQTVTPVGSRLECLDGRTWIFRLPRQLRSLNATMWGHWRAAAQERECWEHELRGAIEALRASLVMDGFVPASLDAWAKLRGQRERRRLQVTRFVPHTRNFLRDDDNLRSCTKHLVDAMTRVALIRDDRREWLQQEPPRQAVSPDGTFVTLVQLDRPDVRGAWSA